jgi:hypothetical protein
MGKRSRSKGAREELAIVKLLQRNGFAASKVSAMYRAGPDLSLPLLGSNRAVEVKVRAGAFKELYRWLVDRDILIIRADRQKPLVIVPLDLAAEVAAEAEGVRKRNEPD